MSGIELRQAWQGPYCGVVIRWPAGSRTSGQCFTQPPDTGVPEPTFTNHQFSPCVTVKPWQGRETAVTAPPQEAAGRQVAEDPARPPVATCKPQRQDAQRQQRQRGRNGQRGRPWLAQRRRHPRHGHLLSQHLRRPGLFLDIGG